jgi:hypothetical protein
MQPSQYFAKPKTKGETARMDRIFSKKCTRFDRPPGQKLQEKAVNLTAVYQMFDQELDRNLSR